MTTKHSLIVASSIHKTFELTQVHSTVNVFLLIEVNLKECVDIFYIWHSKWEDHNQFESDVFVSSGSM